jgi:hypothetical protein
MMQSDEVAMVYSCSRGHGGLRSVFMSCRVFSHGAGYEHEFEIGEPEAPEDFNS